jgi:hypothetical protein
LSLFAASAMLHKDPYRYKIKLTPKDWISNRQSIRNKTKKDNLKDPTKCSMQLKELLEVQKYETYLLPCLGTVNVVWRRGSMRVTITLGNDVNYLSSSFPVNRTPDQHHPCYCALKSKVPFCCFVRTVVRNKFNLFLVFMFFHLLFSQFLFLK